LPSLSALPTADGLDPCGLLALRAGLGDVPTDLSPALGPPLDGEAGAPRFARGRVARPSDANASGPVVLPSPIAAKLDSMPEGPLRAVLARHLPQAEVQAWTGGHLLNEVEPARAADCVLHHLHTTRQDGTGPCPN
jgi:hypothetical protein